MEAMTVRVRGIVQGVGFRYAAQEQFARLAVDGTAENLADGSVRIRARGSAASLEELLSWLTGPFTPGRVRDVVVEERGRDAPGDASVDTTN